MRKHYVAAVDKDDINGFSVSGERRHRRLPRRLIAVGGALEMLGMIQDGG